MVDTDTPHLDLRMLLNAVEAAPPVEAVPVLARELGALVRAKDVSFLIADFSGDTLIRFLPTPDGEPERRDARALSTVPLTGSPYEDALRTQEVSVEHTEGGSRLYAPVTDRGEALGILELALTMPPDDEVVAFVASAAHALAYVVISNRRHTDLFERGQRSTPFSLSAEIQRRLLPDAFTCEGAEFTLAGWLEPAAEVGGDTFDYSVERDSLHLSISDAKGHGVSAAQLATLAVGSLRNTRRSQETVGDQAHTANAAVVQHSGSEDFVTALLLRVELATGRVAAINAGHVDPYLLRDGEVREIQFAADLPFGMMLDTEYREQDLQLQPGDRLVLLTDGMLERNAASLDIEGGLAGMARLHPREVVHTFAREVIGATDGHLMDDATVLCIDWYGQQAGDGERTARAGASQHQASETRQ